MRYEMTVNLTAEKRIRFDAEEGESEVERAGKIANSLRLIDFEGCQFEASVKEINEVTENVDSNQT